MARLDLLLLTMAAEGERSMLLQPGSPPVFGSVGEATRPATDRPLDRQSLEAILSELVPAATLREAREGPAARFDYELDAHHFRFEVTAGEDGLGAVVTLQPPAAQRLAPPRSGELPPIDELLDAMLDAGASDLHLSAGQVPRLRIDGDLVPLAEVRAPSSEETRRLLDPIIPERNARQFDETSDTDFAYSPGPRARFRVNLFIDRNGVGGVFRQIPSRIPTFEELRLPEALRSLTQLPKGLVLVTGPTGSGKSTTLAAMVDLINRTRTDHVITIEDPIEFVHESKSCLINQREAMVHTRGFKQALRAALREDPDIVLVGEMRDLETVSTAIETAETGHLVFGTLHTTTAASTVERIIDQFPADEQGQIRTMLADSLRAVVAQTLLKRIDGGRVAAFEILLGVPAVSNLIREGKTFQIASVMQTGRALGMTTLTDALFDLVKEKVVAAEVALSKAADRSALGRKLEAAGIRLPRSAADDEPPEAGSS